MELKISKTCIEMSKHTVNTPHHRLIVSGQRQTGLSYALCEKAADHGGNVLIVSPNGHMSKHCRRMYGEIAFGRGERPSTKVRFETMDDSILEAVRGYDLVIIDNCVDFRDYEYMIGQLTDVVGLSNINSQIIIANSGYNIQKYWNMVDRLCDELGYVDVKLQPHRHPELINRLTAQLGREDYNREYGKREALPEWKSDPNPKGFDDKYLMHKLERNVEYLFIVENVNGTKQTCVGVNKGTMLVIGGRFSYDWKKILCYKDLV